MKQNIIKIIKKNFTKRELYLVIIIFSLLSLNVGGAMNFIAVQKNGGRMPVLADYKINTDRHFSYQEDNKPQAWIFSDIIPTKYYILSIGDLLMVVGIMVMITGGYYFLKSEK